MECGYTRGLEWFSPVPGGGGTRPDVTVDGSKLSHRLWTHTLFASRVETPRAALYRGTTPTHVSVRVPCLRLHLRWCSCLLCTGPAAPVRCACACACACAFRAQKPAIVARASPSLLRSQLLLLLLSWSSLSSSGTLPAATSNHHVWSRLRLRLRLRLRSRG